MHRSSTMASASEKFDAAVSVIKNLPKNGPFQPSYEMMKRFYGLYKQATEGPCTQAKPAFWNVVQTQKWQAWSALGDMQSEEAKSLYVEELLKIVLSNSKARDIPHLYKIIETMPQTDDVVGFLKIMGPFFELVTEQEAAQEQVTTSAPKVTKVNGHVNGEVKMREKEINGQGDHIQAVTNGDCNAISDLPNGHMEESHHSDTEVEMTEQSANNTEEREEEAEIEEGARNDRFVMVASSRQGDDSAELSHPILISKSQLEAEEEHFPSGSESESDADEFCDSVDEPLINRIRVDHIPNMDSLPSVMEEEEGGDHLTSTPFSRQNAVVTRAEVHNDVDAVIMPHYTTSSSTAAPTPAPSSRGGGEVTSGSKGQQGQEKHDGDQSRHGYARGYRSSGSHSSQDNVDGAERGAVGGGAGAGGRIPGGGGSPLRSPLPDDMVEQITMSLERLQRDMNSVLVRLNTLETIAISRHQIETQQAYMREGIPHPQGGGLPARTPPQPAPSWWPFPTLPVKTVLILLVWPFIVQWIIRFLARNRRPRPPR